MKIGDSIFSNWIFYRTGFHPHCAGFDSQNPFFSINLQDKKDL